MYLFKISILLSSLFGVLLQANPLGKLAKTVQTQLSKKTVHNLIEESPVRFEIGNAKMSLVTNKKKGVSLYQSVEKTKDGGTVLREIPIEIKDQPKSVWSFDTSYEQVDSGLGFKLRQVYKDPIRMGDNTIASVKSFSLVSKDGIRNTTAFKKSREPSIEYTKITGKSNPEFISITNSSNGKPPFHASISALQFDVENFNAVTTHRKSLAPHFVRGNIILEPKLTEGEVVVDMQITDSLDRLALVTNHGRSFTYHMPKEAVPKSGRLIDPVVAEGLAVPKFREKILKSVAFDSEVPSSSAAGISLNYNPPPSGAR